MRPSKIVLANIDYQRHTTNEGEELQAGLEAAGWKLSGFGYDGLLNVSEILDTYRPEDIFVQDKRDWDAHNGGCFDKRVSFRDIGALAAYRQGFKIGVVKDAGSMIDYHQRFIQEIGADAVVTYYHDESVLPLSPWLRRYKRIRTYHSIDAAVINRLPVWRNPEGRGRAVVSGARNASVYPLRQRVFQHAEGLRVMPLTHPGYGNGGTHTFKYLDMLRRFKVHIATASKYGFALRKIIESVAVGTTPVTDLPAYDELPGIDRALVRIAPNATGAEIKDAIDHAENAWDVEERKMYAERALHFYNWIAIGKRLSTHIKWAKEDARGKD